MLCLQALERLRITERGLWSLNKRLTLRETFNACRALDDAEYKTTQIASP
jgi:hypothetical protein